MSIKTTHIVTKDFAIQAIKVKQITDNKRIKEYRKRYFDKQKLKKLSNEDLSDVLEEAIHNGFYNFTIVSEEELEANKDRYSDFSGSTYFSGTPYLDDINNLPEYNDVW